MQEPEDQEGREEREGAEMTTKLRLENDQEKACWIAVIAGFTANSSDICWDSAFQWADRIVSAFRERCGEGEDMSQAAEDIACLREWMEANISILPRNTTVTDWVISILTAYRASWLAGAEVQDRSVARRPAGGDPKHNPERTRTVAGSGGEHL